MYTPLKLSEDPAHTYSIVLRLKSTVSRTTASAPLQLFMKEFAEEAPTRFPKYFQVETEGLNDWVVLGMGPGRGISEKSSHRAYLDRARTHPA